MAGALSVRRAKREDYSTFARLMPELEIPDVVPDEKSWWTERGATTLVAELDGRAVGYGYYEVFGEVLYIRNVVSDPERRRHGIGRRLMTEMSAIAGREGLSELQLNVKEDNLPACRLYESLGYRVTYATSVLVMGWDQLDRYGTRDERIVVRPLEPSEDDGVEEKFGLMKGLLERRRSPKVQVLAAVRDETPVGVGCFEATFPGSYPFKADDLDAARALLEAMHERRALHDATEPWRRDGIQIVVEDQDQLAEAVLSSGAQLRFRVVHMVRAVDL